MALYFECRINKNALLQSVFLAILPTGFHRILISSESNIDKSSELFTKQQH